MGMHRHTHTHKNRKEGGCKGDVSLLGYTAYTYEQYYLEYFLILNYALVTKIFITSKVYMCLWLSVNSNHTNYCKDMLPVRSCEIMNSTPPEICTTENGGKYCSKFCRLCH